MKLCTVKKKLLQKLRNTQPLLKRIADFYVYGSLGYGLVLPKSFPGNIQIPDIRRAELAGIKDALAKVESIDNEIRVKNFAEAKNILISAINKLNSDNKFYNFGKERIITAIDQLSVKFENVNQDLSWRIVYLEDNELIVPGHSEGIDQLLQDEKRIFWKIYSFLSQMKKYFIKDIKLSTDHSYLPIRHSLLMKNFELNENEVQPFIITRLSNILETFYPSLHFEVSRIKLSIYPPLFFLVFSSNDIICLLYLRDQRERTGLFLLPISEYAKNSMVIHLNLIRRYINFLEGSIEEEFYEPFCFWIEKKYLQSFIPPNSVQYFSEKGVLLFYSRETGFFFQIISEGEPYYRVTILPQEYLSKLFSSGDNENKVL
ncbi:hypothetical protein KAU34_04100 [candidate division WOR-3 bacterium]|nr:hypothetical protein [candidate division WOR-3 bacterium]